VFSERGTAGPGTGSHRGGQGPRRSAEAAFNVDAFDAIILAGGHGSRLGGVDKPALVVGERSLVDWVVSAAVEAGAVRVIVVGPSRPQLRSPRVRVVREEPPGSGPVPGLRRGLAEVGASRVAVLAADLPFLRAADLRSLVRGVPAGGGGAGGGGGSGGGAVLADQDGRPQWLAGCWHTAALRLALDGYSGGSLHGLLAPLRPVMLATATDRGGPPPWLDCDTDEDVRVARGWLARAGREGVTDEHA
jgi:molybdopterin-guanine dinucleotide biosynthesis protein A